MATNQSCGPKNRLRGPLPTVGVRPTVDGRREGVREALEGQTLALARSVAELVEGNVRHACGLSVECVVPEFCVGGAAEASELDALFAGRNVGATITVTPCWCYGTETIDLDPLRPKAIWGFNGTERPGAVYLAAACAGHDQLGLPVFKIYGHDVQDPDDPSIPGDVAEQLLAFTRAALAVATLRGKTYLSVGAASMGIAGSSVDPRFFREYLGVRVVTVDMVELVRRIERKVYDEEELERALTWVRENCVEGYDPNPLDCQFSREKKDEQWRLVVLMAMILRDLMVGNPVLRKPGVGAEEAEGHDAVLAGFQGQRHWTDHLPNGDFAETILNSSFDWNGVRQPYLLATENDALNGVAMAFGHLLTGTAQVFADVRTYWSAAAIRRVTGRDPPPEAAGGVIHLINSGSAALDGACLQDVDGKGTPGIKPWWEVTPDDAAACLSAARFHPAIAEYFRGGGFSTSFVTRAGAPLTMSRVNLVAGLGPVLQVAEGRSVELPPGVHDELNRRTNPTWPTTWFVPRLTGRGAFRDVYSVMANWGANHCALCSGHVGHLLVTLASMLRIPVAMHNVPPERVFRPSAWAAFGTEDLEGADFRACSAFGPLYR
ncbi:MAG: L-fucose isomerase [Promethearchaeota archaeon]